MRSKPLGNPDISGEKLTNLLFSDNFYNDKIIDFDRLHFDFKKNSWIIIDHILIDNDYDDFDLLPLNIKNKIKNLYKFSQLFKTSTKENVSLVIDLYYLKELNKNNIIIIKKDKSEFVLKKTSLENYSNKLRQTNYFGSKNNINKNYIPLTISSEKINFLREDNSSFSLSKACLNGDFTYAINIDKIIIYSNKIYMFEYLLCDEKQNVTPYTSHPNRYFDKNKNKFLSLFNLSNKLNAQLYFINYAKENTKYDNQVLLLKYIDIDNKEHIYTDDIKLIKNNSSEYIKNIFIENKLNLKIS